MQQAWTITQLERDLPNQLAQCSTAHERIMVKALHGREVRELAVAQALVRKLTPGEVAIAGQYGFDYACFADAVAEWDENGLETVCSLPALVEKRLSGSKAP